MPKIPKNQRRNPQAEHVQKYHAWREKKGKPKALLPSSRNQPLLDDKVGRVWHLLKDYDAKAAKHHGAVYEKLKKKQSLNDAEHQDFLRTPRAVGYAEIIAGLIIKDFKRTNGLKILEIGAGYGGILFFLKNFMKAKVKGIELGNLSDFHKGKKLGIRYNTDAAYPSMREMGKFDITYSNFVFDIDIMNISKAGQIFENIAHLTRKGGKSYHIMTKKFFDLLADKISALGFEVEQINQPQGFSYGVYVLRKLRD